LFDVMTYLTIWMMIKFESLSLWWWWWWWWWLSRFSICIPVSTIHFFNRRSNGDVGCLEGQAGTQASNGQKKSKESSDPRLESKLTCPCALLILCEEVPPQCLYCTLCSLNNYDTTTRSWYCSRIHQPDSQSHQKLWLLAELVFSFDLYHPIT
jgi:hypothetical protein